MGIDPKSIDYLSYEDEAGYPITTDEIVSVRTLDGRLIKALPFGEGDLDTVLAVAAQLKEIWESGDHESVNDPEYFVRWAVSKRFSIPWLDWAVSTGRLSLTDGATREATPQDSDDRAKPFTTTERNTLLTIIAALCDYSAIKHQERGAAVQIAKMTEELGATVTDDTIRKVLAKIPDALETRMK